MESISKFQKTVSTSQSTCQINGISLTVTTPTAPPISPQRPPMLHLQTLVQIERSKQPRQPSSYDEPGSSFEKASTQAANSGISIIQINGSAQVVPVPSPSPVPAPPAAPAAPLWFNHIITSRDSRSALIQQGADCFARAGLAGFPENEDRAAWLPYVTALGLVPGQYPEIQAAGKRRQTGKMNKAGKPDWNLVLYTVLAVAPGGKMKLSTLFNICLAWSDKLKPNNATCRHNLCVKAEFFNFVDPDEVYDKNDKNGNWWRLANEGEIQIKKSDVKEGSTEVDEDQIENSGSKKKSPASSPARSTSGWTPVNANSEYGSGNSVPSPQAPTKHSNRIQNRKRAISEPINENSDDTAKDEGNGSQSPQTEASRKRKRTVRESKDEDGNGNSQDPQAQVSGKRRQSAPKRYNQDNYGGSRGSQTQPHQPPKDAAQHDDNEDDERTDPGSPASSVTISDRSAIQTSWKEPPCVGEPFETVLHTGKKHLGAHITSSEYMGKLLNGTDLIKCRPLRKEISENFYGTSSYMLRPKRDAAMRRMEQKKALQRESSIHFYGNSRYLSSLEWGAAVTGRFYIPHSHDWEMPVSNVRGA